MRSQTRLVRSLTNILNPEYQVLAREVFTELYMQELCQEYPTVKRTGVVSEDVIDQEIARLTKELKEIDRLEAEA